MDGISTLSPPIQLHWAYVVMVLLGLGLAFAFPVTRDLKSRQQRISYYRIQAITLFGALLGAKLAVLMGDALWPLQDFHDWEALLFSGRSIIGALLVGFLVAELSKPLMAYQLPPNDRFAIVLPFSIGIGRVGCHLVGCCRGVAHDGLLSVAYDDGIARHPIALYELTFHFSMGLLLAMLYRRGILTGRLFAFYLVCYGAFRFASEYMRVTEKAFWSLSAYQWFAIAAVIAGLVALYARRTLTTSPGTPQGALA